MEKYRTITVALKISIWERKRKRQRKRKELGDRSDSFARYFALLSIPQVLSSIATSWYKNV
jgi:hypothetical protein